jgi:ribose transport system ATP-binding protein
VVEGQVTDAGVPPALRLAGLGKTFPSQAALRGVDLELQRGEVRALLGENGSGKSTLIKVLAGYHTPDPGWTAEADGVPFTLGNAEAAREAGLRFIHQDLGLVPELSVIDNLALGEDYVGRRWISSRREAAAAREALSRLGLDLNVHRAVRELAPGEQAGVTIARALRDGLDGTILVLDEPTASLSGAEVDRLHQIVRRIRDSGGAVLYVTHRLGEVFEIADRVTVLRDGSKVADRPVSDLSHAELVRLVVGRDVDAVFPHAVASRGSVAFEAQDICGKGVENVSLTGYHGEILGVAGITGSGREELPYLLFGARRWDSGRLRLGDRSHNKMTVSAALRCGMAFAAADRQRESAIPLLTIRDNVMLSAVPKGRAAWWVSLRSQRREVEEWLERMGVRPPDPELPLASLSGGNQQRVVLARLLRSEPKVMILEEPTRGVDIGAKAEIYRILAEVAAGGAALVICSSDAEELALVCDRVLVLREGRVVAELENESLTEEDIVSHCVMEDQVSLP